MKFALLFYVTDHYGPLNHAKLLGKLKLIPQI